MQFGGINLGLNIHINIARLWNCQTSKTLPDVENCQTLKTQMLILPDFEIKFSRKVFTQANYGDDVIIK